MKNLLLVLFVSLTTILSAQNGTIKGQILDKKTKEVIPFCNVIITGTTIGTTSDIDGNFIIENLEPDVYSVQATFVGYLTALITDIQVTNAVEATIEIELQPTSTELGEIVIYVSPFKQSTESPISVQSVSAYEIQQSPGSNRDVSKVVQTLPGVAASASFRNDIFIRGGAPNENKFYIDDIEIPNINHFATQGASGGPVGMLNVDLIGGLDFYSGAFPANRGNALSSVFNFRQVGINPSKMTGKFTLGASEAGVSFTTPITKNTTFLFSARRSYLQFLFKALDLPFLPTYSDFQTKIDIKAGKNYFTFLGLGALDQFKLNLDANETEQQQYILNTIPINEQWNYAIGGRWKHYFQNGGNTMVVLSRNMLNNSARKYQNNDESNPNNQILDYNSQEIENKARVEYNNTIKDVWEINTGMNYEYAKYNNQTFNRIVTSQGIDTLSYTSDIDFHKYGFFGTVNRGFLDNRLNVLVGFRADANDYNKSMQNPFNQFSPRASISYNITGALKASINSGIYYQLPPYTTMGYTENEEFVNQDNLKYIKNTHFVAGLEYQWRSFQARKISIEGFYKIYDNYPFLTRDSITLANLGADFGVIGTEPAISKSKGRTYGLEVFFQQKLWKNLFGTVSYTMSWSEFQDKNNSYVPSSWDTRHIANITFGKRFKKNWEIGTKFRFQSGLPYTPDDVLASGLIPNWDIRGAGLSDYDLLNEERAKANHSMDLRVDKKWFFDKINLEVYLDIQNLYGSNVNAKPILTVERDDNGDAIIDPTDANRYLTKTLEDDGGTTIPSIGIILGF